jgi:pimeloyl-ACP methyl ester carboxylesterase
MALNPPETRTIRLADGRQMAYCAYGDPDGRPVLYFHGTPGSRYEPVFGDEAGRTHGYRILALDRPGIGRSDGARERRLLDWPQDVDEVAAQLEIERFGVIGVSGGGPYALACGYALPKQITFMALMGSWGPVAAEPTLWNEMAPLDRFFGKLSKGAPWASYVPFALLGYAAKVMPPRGFVKLIASSMSEADKELMRDQEMARFFAENVREAFRQGVRGPADDAIILYGKWGFAVKEVEVAVDLYHGEEDQFAPYRYATYLDERLPRSRLHGYAGKGHLFVMQLFDTVFEQVSTE